MTGIPCAFKVRCHCICTGCTVEVQWLPAGRVWSRRMVAFHMRNLWSYSRPIAPGLRLRFGIFVKWMRPSAPEDFVFIYLLTYAIYAAIQCIYTTEQTILLHGHCVPTLDCHKYDVEVYSSINSAHQILSLVLVFHFLIYTSVTYSPTKCLSSQQALLLIYQIRHFHTFNLKIIST